MFGWLGMQEMAIIGVVAILLFGRDLPGVARSLGKYYNEFKRGISDIQSEFHKATREVEDVGKGLNTNSQGFDDYDDFEEATAPRFEPPPSKDP